MQSDKCRLFYHYLTRRVYYLSGEASSDYFMSFQRDGKMSNSTWAAYTGKIEQVSSIRSIHIILCIKLIKINQTF